MSKELAADYFSRHKGDQCFITSDNRVFHNAGSAQSFANSLENKTVVTHKRVADHDIPKVLTLADFDGFSQDIDYQTAKALLKKLNLTAASQKQPDVMLALNTEFAKLQEVK